MLRHRSHVRIVPGRPKILSNTSGGSVRHPAWFYMPQALLTVPLPIIITKLGIKFPLFYFYGTAKKASQWILEQFRQLFS